MRYIVDNKRFPIFHNVRYATFGLNAAKTKVFRTNDLRGQPAEPVGTRREHFRCTQLIPPPGKNWACRGEMCAHLLAHVVRML